MNLSTEKKKLIVEAAIGQSYGKLTVLELIEYRKTPRGANVPMVKCRCMCGAEKAVSLWDLRSGKTKSCGLNHPRYEDRSLPAFNNTYNHAYKHRAEKAGLVFEITKKQFRELTQKSCHYCGSPPREISLRNKRGGIRKSGKYVCQYIHNGLDRIDSNKGYTLENVVTCCGICNHAKHTMSYTEFITWLDVLVRFRSNL